LEISLFLLLLKNRKSQYILSITSGAGVQKLLFLIKTRVWPCSGEAESDQDRRGQGAPTIRCCLYPIGDATVESVILALPEGPPVRTYLPPGFIHGRSKTVSTPETPVYPGGQSAGTWPNPSYSPLKKSRSTKHCLNGVLSAGFGGPGPDLSRNSDIHDADLATALWAPFPGEPGLGCGEGNGMACPD
jgi:hypothetical protein